jgi:hypothetical protein
MQRREPCLSDFRRIALAIRPVCEYSHNQRGGKVMNKFLMLSAAALVGSAAPALASDQSKLHTIHFFSSNGASYCDGMNFQNAGKHMAVGLHLNEDCAGTNGQVSGTVNKTQYTLNENQGFSESFAYDIYKPIRNGGAWDLWVCLSGTTCFMANQGFYEKGFPGVHRKGVSTTAKVAEMVAAWRASRGSHSR